MEKQILQEKGIRALNVLLIGNNPIEMGRILEKFEEFRGMKVKTEIAFDVASASERLDKFHPNFILIDDNIGRPALSEIMKKISHHRKTKDIPVTVIKNSNYQESTFSSIVQDFILKKGLTANALLNTLNNALKSRRAQEFLALAYDRRKGKLLRLTH